LVEAKHLSRKTEIEIIEVKEVKLRKIGPMYKIRFMVPKEIYEYLRYEIGFEFVDDYLTRLIIKDIGDPELLKDWEDG